MISGTKRLFIVSLGVGLGIALSIAAMYAFYSWHASRHRRVWDDNMIVASPDPGISAIPRQTGACEITFTPKPNTGSSQEKPIGTLSIWYDVKNNSQEDYKLSSNPPNSVAAEFSGHRLTALGMLGGAVNVMGGMDTIVPAGKTVVVSVDFSNAVPETVPADATEVTKHNIEVRDKSALLHTVRRFAGLDLFDFQRHYQIKFPRCW